MSGPNINSSGTTAGTALLPFRLVKRSGSTVVYTAAKTDISVGSTREGQGVTIESGAPVGYVYDGRTQLEVTRGSGIAIDDFLMPGANGIAALHDGTDGACYSAKALQAVAAGAGTIVIEVQILPGYPIVTPA